MSSPRKDLWGVAWLFIAAASFAAGVVAGLFAWAEASRGISIAEDGDEINLVLNMFDERSLVAGLMAGAIAAVVTALVLFGVARFLARVGAER